MKASSGSSKRARASRGSATAASAREPFTNQRFHVVIEGIEGTGAVEVLFPAARIVALQGNRRGVEFDVLVIRRGLTVSTDWYDWWNRARRSAHGVQRTVQVLLLDGDGSVALRWIYPNSLPLSYALSPLNALAVAPVIESLELRVGDFELFQRE
jgi:phage tail-like protein